MISPSYHLRNGNGSSPVDVDHGQVVALRHSEYDGVEAPVELATDVDLERCSSRYDVVVGDHLAVLGQTMNPVPEPAVEVEPSSGSWIVPLAMIWTTAGWT